MPPEVAEFIASPDGRALYYEGLFLGDGEPFAIVRAYWTPALGLTAEDLAPGWNPSLDPRTQDPAPDLLESGTLLEIYGVRIIEATCVYIEPLCLDERDASFLEVSPGTAGLDMARLLIDQTGRPVTYVRTVFRGDRCRLLFSSRETASEGARGVTSLAAK